MNTKAKNVHAVLICSMILPACGDNYFTDNELKERAQEIVYRVLNVLPINLQNMQAVQSSTVDSVLAKKEYISSILSRSTVNVVLPKAMRLNPGYDPKDPTNTKEACISVEKIRGSGNLVSSTRISTAHHVIDGAVTDETGVVKYKISFDGNEYGEMGDTKIENPLLSNRLYVYGLRNWVSATDQLAQDVRRLYLRQWKATLEEHFAKVDTTNLTIKGSDVAILNVLAKTVAYKPSDGTIFQEFLFHPKPTPNFPATPSGPFDMVRPGLFFDIAPHQTFVADTSTASCHTEPINNQDPMWQWLGQNHAASSQ
jgi:hypothetical protein